jgi:hypothetical protein
MSKINQIDAGQIAILLDYNPSTGGLIWKHRIAAEDGGLVDRTRRSCASFNAQFAGKPAFTATDSSGYRFGAIHDMQCRAHKAIVAIMTGCWPEDSVDHINGDRQDNRWVNLRLASRADNNRNMRRRCDNTSGFAGVTWNKRRAKWSAYIRSGGRYVSLGDHERLEDAAAARKAAVARYGYHENHGRG